VAEFCLHGRALTQDPHASLVTRRCGGPPFPRLSSVTVGKRQRARKRQQGPAPGEPSKPDFQITIAALSTTAEIDLSHEMSLVKASLLYADRVTLASPKVMLLAGSAAVFAEDSTQRKKAVADAIGPFDEASAVPALYEQLQRTKRLSPQERLNKAHLEMMLRQTGDELSTVLEQTLQDAGALELLPAFEAGLVHLDPLGGDSADHTELFDNVVAHLQRRLAELVDGSETSYPLFDDEAGGILRAMVAEGEIPDPQFQLANEAGIARSFIAGLDAFPNAGMDVVLDVRERLKTPLVRFRAAVAAASRELDATAVDSGFAREVEDIHKRIVAPALADLADSLEELGVRPTLQRGWPSAATGAMAFLAAAAVGAPELTNLAALAGGVSVAAARERTYRDQLAREHRKNRFLFLYEADRELTRGER
jgi:hypothetical protein